MGNVTAAPEGKGTSEEREELERFRSGEDNLYHAGINVGKEGAYDPTAGKDKEKNQPTAPSSNETPRERPGDPTPLKVVSRERNKAVDKSETNVVRSTSNGRKAE